MSCQSTSRLRSGAFRRPGSTKSLWRSVGLAPGRQESRLHSGWVSQCLSDDLTGGGVRGGGARLTSEAHGHNLRRSRTHRRPAAPTPLERLDVVVVRLTTRFRVSQPAVDGAQRRDPHRVLRRLRCGRGFARSGWLTWRTAGRLLARLWALAVVDRQRPGDAADVGHPEPQLESAIRLHVFTPFCA